MIGVDELVSEEIRKMFNIYMADPRIKQPKRRQKSFISLKSLVGSVVIGTELGREDHGSIPGNCDRRELKPLDAITDSRTRLNWW
jgi:hypothetical protein